MVVDPIISMFLRKYFGITVVVLLPRLFYKMNSMKTMLSFKCSTIVPGGSRCGQDLQLEVHRWLCVPLDDKFDHTMIFKCGDR